jgi:hypothetical protein
MTSWSFERAYSESDIIWEDIYKDKLISGAKTLILWALLLIVSIFLLTPVLLFEISTQIVADLNIKIPYISETALSTYTMTAMTVFLNIILIPFFIDMMVLIEDHPSKSTRQLAILNRNYFFMTINMFLIPLTFTGSIKAFLQAFESQTPK